MSSASARALPRKSSAIPRGSPCSGRAPTGSGGSCSNEKTPAGASVTLALDKLLGLLLVIRPARDHDGAGVLETADAGHDSALRLLDHAAPLRRLVLHLLDQHLGAALRQIGQHLLVDLLGHAAEGQ